MALFNIVRYSGADDEEPDSIKQKCKKKPSNKKQSAMGLSLDEFDFKTTSRTKKRKISDESFSDLGSVIGPKVKKLKRSLSDTNDNLLLIKKQTSLLQQKCIKGEQRSETGLPKHEKKVKKQKRSKTCEIDESTVCADRSMTENDEESKINERISIQRKLKKTIKRNKLDTQKADEDADLSSTNLIENSQLDEAVQEVDEYQDEMESGLVKVESDRNSKLLSDLGGFQVIGSYRHTQTKKVHRVLPDWLAHPSMISADVSRGTTELCELHTRLDGRLLRLLRNKGITKFFPVQTDIIPALLNSASTSMGYLFGKGGQRPQDICCSSPTGSGKTLAFVLPIVQILHSRVVRAIRCLVVVPVSDLAVQVHRVFKQYTEGTDLKVGLVTGLKTFAHEQATLVKQGVCGLESRVDIIVSTPGRLVDHITKTPGFDLTNLRFLVIDEADRVMEEVKQDWLSQVERAVYRSDDDFLWGDGGGGMIGGVNPRIGCYRIPPRPLTAYNYSKPEIPLQKLLFSATLSHNPELLEQLKLFQPKLFTAVVGSTAKIGTAVQLKAKQEPPATIVSHAAASAPIAGASEVDDDDAADETLPPKSLNPDEEKKEKEEENGNDENVKEAESVPGNLTGLEKTEAEYAGKYTTPAGLAEKFIECTKSEKPLALLHVLKELNLNQVLCFTNSVESTHRLYHLLKLIGGVEVREFSSNLHITRRAKILRQFSSGKIRLLICSDAMARGIDVSNVECVISYEIPPFIKTYIHRVGRTARAGQTGIALSLLEKKEIHHFKKMLRESGKTNVKEIKVKPSQLKQYVESMRHALERLPDVLKEEKKRDVKMR